MRSLFLRSSLLLELAPFVLLMAFNQPFFDDFRLAQWTQTYGFWGMQKWYYLYQTGRFASTVFMTALNPLTYGWLAGVKVAVFIEFILLWASIVFFPTHPFSSSIAHALFVGYRILDYRIPAHGGLQLRTIAIFPAVLVLRGHRVPAAAYWPAAFCVPGYEGSLGVAIPAMVLCYASLCSVDTGTCR